MVRLTIEQLNLTGQGEHIASDWQVATDTGFNNIVLNSQDDRVNLSKMVWGASLQPNIKYYARARVLIDGRGWSKWSNVDIFTPEHELNMEENQDLPSYVSSPVITTDSDINNHSTVGFKIEAKGFSVLGNADHLATSWIVEKLNGDAVWSNNFDTINKTALVFTGIELSENTIYRIRVIFHSSSNDSSIAATKTIRTQNVNKEAASKVQALFRSIKVNQDFSFKNTDLLNSKLNESFIINEYKNGFESEIISLNIEPTMTIHANTLPNRVGTYLVKYVTQDNVSVITWVYVNPF